jgi:peptidoglycan hydrolase-like protein with peptidoglycan-binding domain
MRKHSVGKRLFSVIFAFMIGAASAAAAGAALWADPPENLSAPSAARTAPIVYVEHRDERSATAVATTSKPAGVSLARGGVVTSTECVGGASIESGRIVATLDGRPVLGIATSIPFYRDLGPGLSGPDVDALRTALRAMDYDVAAKGAYDIKLVSAVRALQAKHSLEQRDGNLSLRDVMWLPAASTEILSCDALVGSAYTAGSPFLTTAGTLQSLRVAAPDGSAWTPGPRTVQFGSASARVGEDGVVTDPGFLKAVSTSSEYAASRVQGGSPKPVSVRLALAEPLRVARLPISAVSPAKGTMACVRGEDDADHRLRVVGSSGGAVLGVFEGVAPKAAMLGWSWTEGSCGQN